jgi:CubicO group peptidase (beta-lactamase class C family)
VTGATLGQCCLFARPRDYLRLGMMLANEGRDLVSGQQIVPRDFLMQTTDVSRLEPAFAPRPGAGGYENQFWVMRGLGRQFALSGVYGQQIFVHTGLRLVVVHLAVNETAYTSKTTMGRERQALWDSLVSHFSR